MTYYTTDQNLLFGVIALQMDVVTAEQFVRACSSWATDKESPLSDHMLELGFVTEDDRDDIMKMIERQMSKHNNDARLSLMASITPEVLPILDQVQDPDIQASISGDIATLDPEQSNSLTPPDHDLMHTIDHDSPTRDRYTISRLQGRGGVGQVWVARDRDLGREVALKELRSEGENRESVTRRFLQEARITGQLEHPGIVPVYELSETENEGRPFYTMRFVRGQTLRDAIKDYHKRVKIGEAESLELIQLLGNFIDICHALSYAHSREVLHRDLKSENVVIGSYGETVVLDWGLAKVIGADDDIGTDEKPTVKVSGADISRTIDGQILGTPGYMPPEQAEGRLDDIDVRSDVYGLGAILYEILTGIAPFSGDQTLDILQAVIHSPPDRPSSINPGTEKALEAVALKAISKARNDRYQTAMELGEDIQRFLADEPVSCFVEPLGKRVSRWARKHRTAVVGTTILAIAAIVALSVSTVLINKQKQDAIAAKTSESLAKQDAVEQRDLAETAKAESDRLRSVAESERDLAEQARKQTEIAKSESDRLRGLAERDRDAAEQARADAIEQRELARLNFEQAKAAVNQYLLSVGQSDELQNPEFRELRSQLLESAKSFYLRFIEQASDDSSVQLDLVEAFRALAQIETYSGNVGLALEQANEAYEIAQSLFELDSQNARYKTTLIEALLSLSNAQQNSALEDDGLASAQSAIKYATELNAVGKRNLDTLELYDAARSNLLSALSAAGVIESNEELYLALISSYQKRLEEQPDNEKIRLQLAQVQIQLLKAYDLRFQTEEADKLLKDAEQNISDLLAIAPDNTEYLSAYLEWLLVNVTRQFDLKREESLTDLLTTSSEIHQRVTDADPHNQTTKIKGLKLKNLQIRLIEDELDRAAAYLEFSEQLKATPSGTAFYQFTRGYILRQLFEAARLHFTNGQQPRAVEILELTLETAHQFYRESPGDVEVLTNLGTTASLLARIIRGSDHTRSLKILEEALNAIEPTITESSTVSNRLLSLVNLNLIKGQILTSQSADATAAESALRKSTTYSQQVVEEFPNMESTLLGAPVTFASLVTALQQQGRRNEAFTITRDYMMPNIVRLRSLFPSEAADNEYTRALSYFDEYFYHVKQDFQSAYIVATENKFLVDTILSRDPNNKIATTNLPLTYGNLYRSAIRKQWYNVISRHADTFTRLIAKDVKSAMQIAMLISLGYAADKDYQALLNHCDERMNFLLTSNPSVALLASTFYGRAAMLAYGDDSLSDAEKENFVATCEDRFLSVLANERLSGEIAKPATRQFPGDVSLLAFSHHPKYMSAIADLFDDANGSMKASESVYQFINNKNFDGAREILESGVLGKRQTIRRDLYELALECAEGTHINAAPFLNQLNSRIQSVTAKNLETVAWIMKLAVEALELDESLSDKEKAEARKNYISVVINTVKLHTAHPKEAIYSREVVYLPSLAWLQNEPEFESILELVNDPKLPSHAVPENLPTFHAVLIKTYLDAFSESVASQNLKGFDTQLIRIMNVSIEELQKITSDQTGAAAVPVIQQIAIVITDAKKIDGENERVQSLLGEFMSIYKTRLRSFRQESVRVRSVAPDTYAQISETLTNLEKFFGSLID